MSHLIYEPPWPVTEIALPLYLYLTWVAWVLGPHWPLMLYKMNRKVMCYHTVFCNRLDIHAEICYLLYTYYDIYLRAGTVERENGAVARQRPLNTRPYQQPCWPSLDNISFWHVTQQLRSCWKRRILSGSTRGYITRSKSTKISEGIAIWHLACTLVIC
jgi:hypothetical protein